ncbi:inorganic phosphate transporter [Nitratireductor pacificus]|uniref:Phosphate transporter n=1 Tax=Nitratireductor pacificus pht-3B TaxID=391937 RepID=K2MQ07_9HYPH|nr:inorganic phosphate transporter [Nitratireductor pacificus]EKF19407.1 phosphate transporter [Nitratireductor pacificus pht-3B]
MRTHVSPALPESGYMASLAKARSDLRDLAPFLGRLLVALSFVVAAMVYALVRAQSGGNPEFALWIATAAGFGAYMALNIGANDVANNVGPVVGAGVIPLGGALIMAALFEFGGALIAGGSVISTVRGGIVMPEALADRNVYVWVMMAALLAAALWLNLATVLGAPVSTTHSIVGGVMGGGIAAAGLSAVDWSVMANIAASWIVSPFLGGLFAALFLYAIKRFVTYQPQVLEAAQRIVPLLVAAMTWSFGTYLILKGLKKIWAASLLEAGMMSALIALVTWGIARALIRRRLPRLRNDKSAVNQLLALPLIFSAALLSFAHGSNDVANAIGPLAGIYDVLSNAAMQEEAVIPLWVMGLGAAGLAIGLLLFGPRVIHTVGAELTKLDAMRAYCIAMAATITVIAASQLGLPVSTTHVTVGAVLGVGFLREWLKRRHALILSDIRALHADRDTAECDAFIARLHATPFAQRKAMIAQLRRERVADNGATVSRNAACRSDALVNRALMARVLSAWIITVPLTALISALIYFTLRGIML